MPPPQVFISYRRDDAAGYARAIGDALGHHFGAERIFIDVDDIQPGQTFATLIESQIDGAVVMLVLIGRRWRGERADGTARLDDEADFVRREVAAGLASRARLIPVLLDGATMPDAAQLPAPLRPLAGRHALAIDATRYAADLQRLVDAVGQDLRAPPPIPPPARPVPATPGRRTALALAALGLLGGLAWLAWRTADRAAPAAPAAQTGLATSPGAGQRPASAPAAARLAINGRWQAEVQYDWLAAPLVERFDFQGDGSALHGSASFLRVPRGVLDGQLGPDGLRFVTRTAEGLDAGSRELVHQYQGRLVGDELHLLMQTTGGQGARTPVRLVARRLPPAGP
jgi:TIR domain